MGKSDYFPTKNLTSDAATEVKFWSQVCLLPRPKNFGVWRSQWRLFRQLKPNIVFGTGEQAKKRSLEPLSLTFGCRWSPTPADPQSQTQARKKHFRHWKGPWLITCSPIGTIFDEGVRHDLLDTLPTFQARRQSGGSVRSARTRGKSCREFRAKSNRQSALYTSAALARLQVSTKIQHFFGSWTHSLAPFTLTLGSNN